MKSDSQHSTITVRRTKISLENGPTNVAIEQIYRRDLVLFSSVRMEMLLHLNAKLMKNLNGRAFPLNLSYFPIWRAHSGDIGISVYLVIVLHQTMFKVVLTPLYAEIFIAARRWHHNQWSSCFSVEIPKNRKSYTSTKPFPLKKRSLFYQLWHFRKVPVFILFFG